METLDAPMDLTLASRGEEGTSHDECSSKQRRGDWMGSKLFIFTEETHTKIDLKFDDNPSLYVE